MLIDFPASSEKEGFIHQACALAQRLACLFSESKITDLSSCSLCTLLFFFFLCCGNLSSGDGSEYSHAGKQGDRVCTEFVPSWWMKNISLLASPKESI